MPKLVDTTIRLLSQEPLAGQLPTAEVLRVAEILDQAGFACLEVSGGGVFDATVRRRVESPWERIRAIKGRVSTPLGIALRGRFLVGSRPVSGDIVGRFVSCAAENGIDVFRLHDPLNDVSNLREAGAAITSAGGAFHAGLVYSPGRTDETDTLVEQARKLPDLGATRILVNDPTGALVPHKAQELVARIRRRAGFRSASTCRARRVSGLRPRSRRSTRAPTSSRRPSIRSRSRCTVCRASPSRSRWRGSGHATGVDVAKLWDAADVIDEYIGDEPVAQVAPRIAVRAAEYDLPAGLVAALEVHLRAHAAADRLLEVLEEVGRVRAEAGWPPLAAPIGQILASQALLHVLEARRYGSVIDEFRELVQGGYGVTPEPIDSDGRARRRAPRAARAARGGSRDDGGRSRAGRGPRRERGRARPHRDVRVGRRGAACSVIRARHSRDTVLIAEDADAERGERIRELVKIVQESGVGEIEIEDEGHARLRPSRRRAGRPGDAARRTSFDTEPASTEVATLPADGVVRVESPMVGVFYRASSPGRPPSSTSATPSFPDRCCASSRR